MKYRNVLKLFVLPLTFTLLTQAGYAKKTDLVAVSADIVEISGSLSTSKVLHGTSCLISRKRIFRVYFP